MPEQVCSSLSKPHTGSSLASNKPQTSRVTFPFLLGKKKSSMNFFKKKTKSLSFSKAWRKHLGSYLLKHTVHAELAVAYMAPGEQRKARKYAETFSNPSIRKGLLTNAHKAQQQTSCITKKVPQAHEYQQTQSFAKS